MNDIRFVKESGVCPWEQSSFQSDLNLQTITIVAKEKVTLIKFVSIFLDVISYAYQKIFRWYTVGYEFEGGLVQRKKLLNTLKSPLSGFSKVYVPKEFPKNVPCSVSELSLPFNIYHYDAITDGQHSVLILSQNGVLRPEPIYNEVSDYVLGLRAKDLADLFAKKNLITPIPQQALKDVEELDL